MSNILAIQEFFDSESPKNLTELFSEENVNITMTLLERQLPRDVANFKDFLRTTQTNREEAATIFIRFATSNYDSCAQILSRALRAKKSLLAVIKYMKRNSW